MPASTAESAQASGGEHLSSTEVSSLPLNARDFSKLLLLAAGTMTDANGAANFTQQFAVNGQRGVGHGVRHGWFRHHRSGMGGATFSNFNVDAIQEVQSSSGVMPAEIGHGAASFTNVVTKSGAEPDARQPVRIRAQCRVRCAQLFRLHRPDWPAGASRRLCAMNLDLPTAARSCFRASMTAAAGRFISASTRDFARCWEPRR